MNTWIKYGPLAYTNNTRINGPSHENWYNMKNKSLEVFNLSFYIWYLMWDWFIALLFLFLIWMIWKFTFFSHFLLYVYLFVIFINFYEIWYITNDIFCSKNEKNPTPYIRQKLTNKFWISQIIIRFFVWWILLIPLVIVKPLFYRFIFLLLFMWIVFFIHNFVRNYNINIFTMQILRFTKITIFLLVIKDLWLSYFESYQLINSFLISQCLLLFNERWDTFNNRLWWKNADKFYCYWYIFILNILLFIWVLTNNKYFVIPLVILIPKIVYFVKTKPPYKLYNRKK